MASAIEAAAGAAGVLVVVEGLHLCMVARGVEKHASSTTTVAARGANLPCSHAPGCRERLLSWLVLWWCGGVRSGGKLSADA